MTFFIVLSSCSLFAQQVQLQFTTINGYGNNLYIDNVSVGNQKNIDVGVLAINNILPDTSYLLGSSSIVIAPIVAVINVGKNNVTTPFNITMTVVPGTYSSTKSVVSLNSGQSQNITFDNLTVNPAQPLNITVTASLTGDENPANNILNQFSIYFTGVQRTVLLEEWTSSTCGPCAANNPTVDAFISARFDSLVPIKYHMNWPSPGNDPMYAYNPTQANDRRFYYGVNAVPHVIMDGIVNPSYPYSNAPSLPDAFYPRKNVGTPISMTVTDTRLPGDTIQTDITVQVIAPLKAGQYYLRVHAIERKITYATPPGTNGESIFYDVFRKACPTSLGTPVPTAVGNYNFSFKYKLDLPAWVDSMIYTAAFIQNDATKEVLNSGKARNYTFENIITSLYNGVPVEKPILDFGTSDEEYYLTSIISNESLSNTFTYEFFESSFPAAGWKIVNPDAGITFAQFTGANGPSFGGNKSIKLDFYSYSTTGRADTLYSKIFTGLDATDTLKFDWAYAEYSATYVDRLIVKLSQDGGLTFPYTLFDKSGSALATAPSTTSSFTPGAGQWKTFSYGLSMLIPVELTSFTASAVGSSVELKWQTATEKNNLGFEVQRKSGNEFVTIGHVRGNGTTTQAQSYAYTDRDLLSGKYTYRLKQVDYNGAYEFSKFIEVEITAPKTYSLEQNYPNPFNPSTKINFNLAVDSKVMLKVFNLLGEEVRTLVNGNFASGNHNVDFNAANLNNGVYIYKLEAVGSDGSTFTSVKKMTLLK
jgi:hypothetical protein